METCNEVLAERGSAPMQIRVGVAAGPLVQGNMGSALRLEYTVIGDTVNLAARLESSAGHGRVLMTRAFYGAATSSAPMGSVLDERVERVKGKQETIEVVELGPAG